MSETNHAEKWLRASGDGAEWPADAEPDEQWIEALGEPFFVVDRRGGFRDWNDRFREAFGYTDEQLASMEAIELIAEADRSRAWLDLTRIADGETVRQEHLTVGADGERQLYEFTAGPLSDEEGDVFGAVVTAREVPEGREYESDLLLYERLIETVGDGVIVLDEAGVLQRVNDAVVEMTGYDRDELLGKHITILVPESTEAEARRRIVEEDKEILTINARLLRKDGGAVPAEIRFSHLDSESHTIGLVRDVSDERERDRLIGRLHDRMGELMDAETVEGVAETAASLAREHFACTTVGVRLLTDADRLELVALASGADEWDVALPDFDVDDEVIGRAYRTGEIVVYDDLSTLDLGFDPAPISSLMVLPIEGYGLVAMGSKEAGAFAETDRGLARLFVADVEAAFQRADREQQLRERAEELTLYETLVETMGDGVYATDENHRVTMVNDSLAEMIGCPAEALLGSDIHAFVDEAGTEKVARKRQEMLTGERDVAAYEGPLPTAEGEDKPVEDRFSLLPRDDGEFAGTVGVVRDISERKEWERTLRFQRDELETLVRIAELVQETTAALTGAATREEIEETICERLSESPLYNLAFTGTRTLGDGRLATRVWAGDGGEISDSVESCTREADAPGAIVAALEAQEVTVLDDVSSGTLCDPLAEAAAATDAESIMVVPFHHHDVLHGFLCVFADRSGAFSFRETQAFSTLGDIVGFAISAIQNRRVVESDTVLGLSIRIEDADSFLGALSSRCNCDVEVVGAAQTTGAGNLLYVDVGEVTREDVAAVADRYDVSDLRLVREDDEHVFEVNLPESIHGVSVESGVDPNEIVAEAGTVAMEATAPRDVNLRRLIERLESAFGPVSLEKKHEVRGWEESGESVGERIDARLTDRQRSAVLAAYYGGYFDWPRDSDAEAVADSLGISSATLHQHLRKAQRKIMEVCFDERGGPSEDLDS